MAGQHGGRRAGAGRPRRNPHSKNLNVRGVPDRAVDLIGLLALEADRTQADVLTEAIIAYAGQVNLRLITRDSIGRIVADIRRIQTVDAVGFDVGRRCFQCLSL